MRHSASIEEAACDAQLAEMMVKGWGVVVGIVTSFLHGVDAYIVAAGILPHGDFAYDPALLDGLGSEQGRADARKLQAASAQVADAIAAAEPDVVVLTTPHGLQLDWDIAVYTTTRLKAEAVVGRDLDASFSGGPFAKYTVQLGADGVLTADEDLAAKIAGIASRAHRGSDGSSTDFQNATGLRGFGDAVPLPLEWGEVVALAHLDAAYLRQQMAFPRVVVLGLPASRYSHSGGLAEDFRGFGRGIAGGLSGADTRVAFVVSTDLSHRHWHNTTFGFSGRAEAFETAVAEWAESLDASRLMVAARRDVDEIMSCGWLGLAILQGIFDEKAGSSGTLWKPGFSVGPFHPTYYGMISAFFVSPKGSVEEALVS